MKTILILLLTVLAFTSCKSKLKPRELGNYSYTTSAIDKRENKILVTAWGKGNSEEEALIEAKRNAINDILYKGIQSGNPSIRLSPVFMNKDAITQNQEFNASFFSNNGAFLNYVDYYDASISQSRSKKKRKADRVLNMAFDFQLLIDRDKLIIDLKNQGILK